MKKAWSIVLFAASAAFSQSTAPVSSSVPGTAPAAARSDASPIVSENKDERLKTPITLRAQDASLPDVLRVLSERSRMNFVAGQSVENAKITIILDRTPLDESIDLIVRAAGLSYEIAGNSILIATPDRLKEEVGRSAYVVQLRYANAAEVAAMLEVLTKNIKVEEGGNRLVCYTSPSIINEIERIVKAVDHPHVQVLLETRLIEVSMDKLKEYGINWSQLSPIATTVSHPAVPLMNGYDPNGWQLGPVSFNATLDLLSQTGDARILMDSKLTTTNNREASLHIGDIIPYVIQSYNPGAAGGASQQIQKEEVGVKLKMTPHVNDDQQITLSIDPEVSSIVAWKGQAEDIPLVRTRKTHTSVRVKDGQTVFLAGLISEEKTLEIRKLPLLGDIPLLGRIFQKRKSITRKSNLIMEITPRILTDAHIQEMQGQLSEPKK